MSQQFPPGMGHRVLAASGTRLSFLLCWGSPRGRGCHPLTFLCFLAIHLSQLLSISSHLDSRCRSTSKGTSSSLWDGGRGHQCKAPQVLSSTLCPVSPPHRAQPGHT